MWYNQTVLVLSVFPCFTILPHGFFFKQGFQCVYMYECLCRFFLSFVTVLLVILFFFFFFFKEYRIIIIISSGVLFQSLLESLAKGLWFIYIVLRSNFTKLIATGYFTFQFIWTADGKKRTSCDGIYSLTSKF